MPRRPPPFADIAPNHALLPAGKVIWRVHRTSRTADRFVEPSPDPARRGGRFDGTAHDPYPFLYGGESARTALAEVLLRDVPFNDDAYRVLPAAMIAGRSLSALEIVHELRFVDLRTAQDLAAVSQDDWLVQAEPQDYEHTRDWARWLRSRSDAAGFIWQSRRDRPNATYVVFADRCAGMLKVQEHQGFELDTPVGLARLNELLRPYRAVVDPG